MVGEIFQEILSSLSVAAILVCLVTSVFVFVLVPCSDEVGKKGRSSSVVDSADKECLYEQKRRNLKVIRDLRKGRMIGLSGSEVWSKADDHEVQELKSANLECVNAAGDDDRVFSGVSEEFKGGTIHVCGVQAVRGEVLDECSEKPVLFSQIKEEQKSHAAETSMSETKREEVSEFLETDKLKTEKASFDEEEDGVLFDDWEGIEKTKLEKLFGKAVAFVGSNSNADLVDNNVRLQLYGLHKVATEGPCRESDQWH